MRWRVVAVSSLGANLVLAAVWVYFARYGSASAHANAGASAQATNSTARPRIVLRRQFFSWQEVESPDYPTYILNLRGIGCPEQTIRDIIIADVNALYARRRAQEVVTANQQWWRPEPDTNILRAATEKSRELEDERRALLVGLLGQGWESRDMTGLPRPSRPGVVLDGPLLGPLPAETKQAIQEISTRSQDRLDAYLQSVRNEGEDPDQAQLAKLRQETRDELARVLSPGALEEFLLRYSQYATNLRTEFGQLKYFNPSPDEFRAIFRSTDNFDQQIQALGNDNDPNTVSARKTLSDQRENAIKLALGPKRYEEYALLHDPLYRDAVATAQQAGTPEAARTLYQINQAAAGQGQSILGDDSLTPDQKNIALKSLEVDQLKANAVATGQELPPEPQPAAQPPPRRTYVIRNGDSAAVVSLIYGVPVSAIRAANPNVNVDRLQPGQTITIPRNALTPQPPGLPPQP